MIKMIEEKVLDIKEYYHDLKLIEKKSKIIKDRIEEVCTERRIDKAEIDGYIVKKEKREHYVWKKGIYNVLKKYNRLNSCLKHGNEMKDRFNLKPYLIPKTLDDLYIRAGKIIPTKEFLAKEQREITELISELNNVELNNMLHMYAQQKKLLDILKGKYDIDKKELLNLMLEEGIGRVDGFSISEKEDRYDFEKMPSKMEEKVLLATNGTESIDLFKLSKTSTKNLETLETMNFGLDDLDNYVRIEKRFGKAKLDFLYSRLGDFIFVEGYRIEEDVHSRFPINNGEVDKLIFKGEIPEREVFRYKRIDHSKEPIEFFEVISVENNEERRRGLMATKS